MTQKDKIDRMFNILTGNGEVGVCEQVRKNTDNISSIKEKLKTMPLKWRSWLTFGLTVLTVILLAISIYRGIK